MAGSKFYPDNDAPVFESLIESRDQLRDRVVDAVVYGETRQVYGIEGDWGSGKTSFLHDLYHTLEGECDPNPRYDVPEKERGDPPLKHIRCIWFEAWRYQQEEMPIVALLQEIRSQLGGGRKFFRSAQKLGEVAIRSSFGIIDNLIKTIGAVAPSLSTVQKTGEEWEKRNFAATIPAHHIRKQLDKAIKDLVGIHNDNRGNLLQPRLVIMIDDLDRCDPKAAYRLLEGIKIYLELDSCIVLLAMNEVEIQQAIIHELADCFDDDEPDRFHKLRYRAQEYMEKLCGTTWRLPAPVNSECATYARDLLFPPGTAKRSTIDKRRKNLAERCLKIFVSYHCLPANPRKIKALCNRLLHVATVLQNRLLVDEPESQRGQFNAKNSTGICIIVSALYCFHPRIYRILAAHPDFYGEQLRKWCIDPPQSDKEKEKFHQALHGLVEMSVPEISEKDPERNVRSQFDPSHRENCYPNPVDLRVFRIQHLVAAIEADEKDLSPFFALTSKKRITHSFQTNPADGRES